MRTLKVKCPTWQHVETFYERKLRHDKTLTIRVPFQTEENATIMLGLQLPDGMVMAIEGTVRGIVPGPPGQKDAIRLQLHGLTDDVLSRLRALVAEARSQRPKPTPPPQTRPTPATGTARQRAPAPPLPPTPLPEDAPISEPVQPLAPAGADDLPRPSREVYDKLDTELSNLRECAAHEVLGVQPDADVADVRRAYFACTKRYHPDLFARYRSPAIVLAAQEMFIHINRAYDRMRNSLMVAGRAVIAGPALLAHDGWLAGMDDIVTDTESPTDKAADAAVAPPAETRPVDRIRAAIDELLSAGDFEGARGQLADALHTDPRNRELRALYYVVSGNQALADDDAVTATAQFEAALAHDPDCAEARAALDDLRKRGKHRAFPRFVR